jgi:hypothetical protein
MHISNEIGVNVFVAGFADVCPEISLSTQNLFIRDGNQQQNTERYHDQIMLFFHDCLLFVESNNTINFAIRLLVEYTFFLKNCKLFYSGWKSYSESQ